VIISGKDAASVERAARALARLARSVPRPEGGPLTVLGPAPAPIARIRDRVRWQLLLQGGPALVREVGREILNQARTVAPGTQVRVDPAPLQML
jgi:primosomal protein N' (replication factor Y)